MTNTPPKTTTDAATPHVDLTSKQTDEAATLPHERDQQVGATGGVPDAKVQQGARDVARGIQDTSRSPEADAAYKKLKKG